MKYIKTYENSKDPEIGDWVYCEVDPNEYKNSKFIGKYKGFSNRTHYPYEVEVDWGINESDMGKRIMYRREIIAFSKNKKDLEIYLDTSKYNL